MHASHSLIVLGAQLAADDDHCCVESTPTHKIAVLTHHLNIRVSEVGLC